MGSNVVEWSDGGFCMISRDLKQGDRILALLQEDYPEYHPLMGLAKIAHTTDDDRLKFDCHKTLAGFIEPTLKAVEVSTAPRDSERLTVIFEGDCAEVPEPNGPPALEHTPTPVDEIIDAQYEDLEATLELNLHSA